MLKYIFIINLILISPAYAYLDPITTLVIFQAIVAFFAGAYAVIVLKPLKFLKKLFSKNNKEKDNKEKN